MSSTEVPLRHLQNGSLPSFEMIGKAVREECAKEFQANCPSLVAIVKDEASTKMEKIRAMDMLGKYGGLQQTDIGEDRPAPYNIAEDLPSDILDQIDKYLDK